MTRAGADLQVLGREADRQLACWWTVLERRHGAAASVRIACEATPSRAARKLGGMTHSFIPDDCLVRLTLTGPGFRLEPPGPQHNDADYRAWMSSIEHIHATPGFSTGRWPPADGMSLDENLRDLRSHAEDF